MSKDVLVIQYYLNLNIRQLMYYTRCHKLCPTWILDLGSPVIHASKLQHTAAIIYILIMLMYFKIHETPVFCVGMEKSFFSVFVLQAEQPICLTKNNLWYYYGLWMTLIVIKSTFDVIKSSKVKGIFQMAVKGPISWCQSNLWDNYGHRMVLVQVILMEWPKRRREFSDHTSSYSSHTSSYRGKPLELIKKHISGANRTAKLNVQWKKVLQRLVCKGTNRTATFVIDE